MRSMQSFKSNSHVSNSLSLNLHMSPSFPMENWPKPQPFQTLMLALGKGTYECNCV